MSLLDSLNEFGKHIPKPETKPHPPNPALPNFPDMGGKADEPTMKDFEEIFSEEFAKEVMLKVL